MEGNFFNPIKASTKKEPKYSFIPDVEVIKNFPL